MPVPSQINPVHARSPYFSNNHFNTILAPCLAYLILLYLIVLIFGEECILGSLVVVIDVSFHGTLLGHQVIIIR
jgi:hypothetical protein